MTARAMHGGQALGEGGRDGPVTEVVVTRFAPSPTGRLHLGHAYSAVRAHDLARAAGGRFLLRIEDIDGTRARPEHVADIVADLAWLGLSWDGYAVQSERMALYAAALARLRAMGVVYPCFCTRGEIAAALGAPHAGEGAVYPGTCRGLVAPDLARGHAWRLDVEAALRMLAEDALRAAGAPLPLHHAAPTACFASRLRGCDLPPASRSSPLRPPPRAKLGEGLRWWDSGARWIHAYPGALGDVVVARKDVATSYHLAVVVDDAEQGVTDVVRGVDLFAATHVHRLLQALLGLPTPRYHHHPLLIGADGERLAKRHGSPSLAAMRLAEDDGGDIARRLRARLPHGDVGFGLRSPK